jgi:tetratricopeptide (TPR) repeat protein
MKVRITLALIFSGAMLCLPVLAAQEQGAPGQVDGPLTETPQVKKQMSQKPPANSAPPRSDDESSSNQTRLDLSPPTGDMLAHPDGGHVADDVMELHEWNPLRAMKDVEVGDYYFRAGSYKAALSRYREALQFKPRDAVATFKLAQTLERTKELEEARLRYQEYLSILKDGPSAAEARKALERLKQQKTQ